MLISYEYYKSRYSDSELTETTFNEYANIINIYFLSRVVYSENEIALRSSLEDIKLMLVYQINHFEKRGLYEDGITNQSTNGASQSVNNNKNKGDLNISTVFDLFISMSGLGIRRC